MNKYQYTPKEWRSEYCGKDRIRISKISDKRRIATIAVKSRIMDEANARLIAAAPELLAALQNIVVLQAGQGRLNLIECAAIARAAIA